MISKPLCCLLGQGVSAVRVEGRVSVDVKRNDSGALLQQETGTSVHVCVSIYVGIYDTERRFVESVFQYGRSEVSLRLSLHDWDTSRASFAPHCCKILEVAAMAEEKQRMYLEN